MGGDERKEAAEVWRRRLVNGFAGLMCVLAAVWIGLQSYAIAAVGVGNAIPQLEGDGGAGVIFAVMLLLGGILLWWRPLWSTVPFALALAPALLAGWLYQDVTMWWWCLAPVLFGLAGVGLHRWRRRTRPASQTV